MQIHTLISCGTGSSRSQFPSTLAKLANTGSVANAKLSLKRKVMALSITWKQYWLKRELLINA